VTTRSTYRWALALLLTLLSAGLFSASATAADWEAETGDEVWYTVEADDVTVDLYFYWSPTCPHCQAARPFIEALPTDYPWINLHSHDVSQMSDTEIDFAQELQVQVGESIQGVPAFFYCGVLQTGFGEPETTGVFLVEQLNSCRQALLASLQPNIEEPIEANAGPITDTTAVAPPSTTQPARVELPAIEEVEEPITLPLIGEVDAENVSLPVFTVAIAAFDAFNPCAFFVLLFLLSLLVHARSRARMALIGGIFVLFSGAIYFVFMAAWLNVFLWVGPLRIFTAVAGVVALTLAAVNIKDYFVAGVGPSLSIPEGAKPGLFKRMRGLTKASSFGAVAIGAATLAIAANSYELLCTTGFPLAFTRVLTLNELPTAGYYSYLVLYNVIYVVPLLVIVGVFVWKLGSRKLGEREGRVLKLMSGTMMAGLGLVMLFNPDLLGNMLTAVFLLIGALAVTFVITRFDKIGAGGIGKSQLQA